MRKINPRAVFEGWTTNLLHNLELKQEKSRLSNKGEKNKKKFKKIDDFSDSNSSHSGDSVGGFHKYDMDDNSNIEISESVIEENDKGPALRQTNTVTGKYLGNYIDE